MSRYEFTCWIENSRFCNERTFSQLNPQMIIQTDTSLIWWGGVYNGAQTLEQCQKRREPYTEKCGNYLQQNLLYFPSSNGKERNSHTSKYTTRQP